MTSSLRDKKKCLSNCLAWQNAWQNGWPEQFMPKYKQKTGSGASFTGSMPLTETQTFILPEADSD